MNLFIRDLKDLKGTTEKTEKNGKTEKKDSFHPIILKNISDFPNNFRFFRCET